MLKRGETRSWNWALVLHVFQVELKPYVLDDQVCDFCHGMKCSGRSAPLFCSQVGCLAYLCEHCWTPYHSSPGKDHHKPVTKESSVDRSRPAAMRWWCCKWFLGVDWLFLTQTFCSYPFIMELGNVAKKLCISSLPKKKTQSQKCWIYTLPKPFLKAFCVFFFLLFCFFPRTLFGLLIAIIASSIGKVIF